MDLFAVDNMPLSKRVIPSTIDDFVGQQHLLAPGKPIRTMIETRILHSMILVGPPASGKTSLAHLISRQMNMMFISESALTIDSESLKKIFSISSNKILFIDEFHRLTKPKQDMLLGPLERGEIIIIGATTENPNFIIQPALRSRIFTFELYPLNDKEIKKIILNALKIDKILSNKKIRVSDEALDFLIEYTKDVRKSMNAIEICINQKIKSENELNEIVIEKENIQTLLQSKDTGYSKIVGHYDVISAFIKSIRGSDPDAAVYYLSIMLESGEDPLFIARRLNILASEDIGLAYPEALPVATSAYIACEKIGLPEARIILAEVTVLFSLLPKSNTAYMALENATSDIRKNGTMPVPEHLKNIHIESDLKTYISSNNSKDYRYPHDFPNHFINESYLSSKKQFFHFSNLGFEKQLKKWFDYLRKDDANSDTGDIKS